ncbi:helix-turn-helix transcriptional regulator [Rhodococcus sovatensis]|uniref:Helix-turn-helix transcriptional regulator n=1 Tax=Rhodococcus sovatensis TaxID=1805840 RepID=A0ABZ2PMT7_9NOCA
MTSALAGKRQQLSDFLRSRRARVKPADVGLPEYGRRNTPGLRREEVSVLAGVSASWYTWLEQGRDIRVSPAILDAIASALRLDAIDRAHLYNLADMNPPASTAASSSTERSLLVRFARDFPSPAFVVDKGWNVLYVNDSASTILHLREGYRTFLECFFLEEYYRTLFVNWAEMAECFVGSLRVRAGATTDDENLKDLVASLSSNSFFATLWQEHSTAHRKARKVVLLRNDGPQTFDAAALDLSGCDDLQLISYIPREDDA